MLDVVDARFEGPFQTVASVGMTSNPHTPAMRFIHDRLYFFETEKGLIHHRSVRFEIERASRNDFHVVNAIVSEFSHGGPHFFGAIGDQVSSERFELQWENGAPRGGNLEERAGCDDAWASNKSAL